MKDKIIILGLVFFFMAILFCLILLIYYTDSYLTLRDVIKRCDKDLGKGSWTFIETKDNYSCNKISSNEISSKWCYENGIEVPC